MSLPNPLLLTISAGVTALKTTSAATADYNATEADQIILSSNGTVLGAAETILVFTVTSDNSTRIFYNWAQASQYSCVNGQDAILLPGGFYYRFAKSATGTAIGIDVSVKPRIGFSGS